MPKVFITEMYRPSLHHGQALAVGKFPPIVEQTVNIGASSAQSSAFNANTRMIRVHTDAVCSVAIGSNPTATANAMRLAAGGTEYLEVEPGHKIAVITNT